MLVLAGISKAVKDRIMTGWYGSKFKDWGFDRQWWDNTLSWRNKWKVEGSFTTQRERFPLSSTLLVFVTDAWHCFDLVFMISFALGIWSSPLNLLWSITIVLTIFQLAYSFLKSKSVK